MGAKIQAFDIFQTPLSSHYPLPLSRVFLYKICEMEGRVFLSNKLFDFDHVDGDMWHLPLLPPA